MKKRREKKRYPYIEINGVENTYLDAILMNIMDEHALNKCMASERNIVTKAELSLSQINKATLTKKEIIMKSAPYLHCSYSFYNFLAMQVNKFFHIIDSHWDEAEEELHNIESLENAVDSNKFPYTIYLNYLRFNSKLHPYFKGALEKYGQSFQRDTGISLSEEYSIKELKECNCKDKNTLTSNIDNIISQLQDLKEKTNTESFKDDFERERTEKIKLEQEMEELKKEFNSSKNQLKANEQLLIKKDRELSALNKNLESEQKKNSQSLKDVGKLGQEIGNLRKEMDSLKKQNDKLEVENNQLRASKAQFQQELESRLYNQWNAEKSILIDELKQKVKNLDNENKNLKQQVDEYRKSHNQVEQLESELFILQNQLNYYTQTVSKLEEEISNRPIVIQYRDRETPDLSHLTPSKEDEFNIDDILFGLPENEPEPV